ncbi:MAG: thymidine kinase [Phycisphaerae bacterium]|nr:thymidine kinase [Phycisphaerae bacterium]
MNESVDPPTLGRLTLICGCMFSGKTTELFRRLANPSSPYIIFKHALDNRYLVDSVVSHGGKALPASCVRSAAEIPDRVPPGVELVAIDEGHFFSLGLVEVATGLRKRGISMLVTALDRDSWGVGFPVVRSLLDVADEVNRLTATCARCGRQADRTQRTTPIIQGRLIGGPESYEARCGDCWHPPKEAPPENQMPFGTNPVPAAGPDGR